MRQFTPTPSSPINDLRARQMRSAPTESERVLFDAIRGGRVGATVRRQLPLGRYIVDFLVPSRKFVIEVDAPWHSRRGAADARRDRWLARRGYRVLRLDAEVVLARIAEVVALIRAALAAPR